MSPKASSIDEIQQMIRNGIRIAKASGVVIDFDKRVQASDKFTSDFKAEIHQLATVRVDELDTKK